MTIDDLLIEATKKLIQIDGIIDWQNELLSKAPPVLWFGNSKSEKPKILTMGANPSRWELNKSGKIFWPMLNLGNPKGFNANGLNELGRFL